MCNDQLEIEKNGVKLNQIKSGNAYTHCIDLSKLKTGEGLKITTKSHNYGTWEGWWWHYTFVPDPSKPITPLHVTVDFFNRSATSWDLPYIDDEGYGHGQEIERTICITKDDYKNTERDHP